MHSTGWIEFESTTFVRPSGYALVAGVANFERNPKSWIFEGYNYATQKWEQLDMENSQDFVVSHNTATTLTLRNHIHVSDYA